MMLSVLVTAAAAALSAVAAPMPQDNTPLPPDHPIWWGRPLYWNYNLQKCMGVEGAWQGARVIITNCLDTPNPWTWDVGPYTGQIALNNTGLCLDAGKFDKRHNGVQLTVQKCSTHKKSAQTWWYPSHPDNPWRRIELAGGPGTERTNMCVDLTDGNAENGALQLWQCYAGNPNQVWDLGRWCAHC